MGAADRGYSRKAYSEAALRQDTLKAAQEVHFESILRGALKSTPDTKAVPGFALNRLHSLPLHDPAPAPDAGGSRQLSIWMVFP